MGGSCSTCKVGSPKQDTRSDSRNQDSTNARTPPDNNQRLPLELERHRSDQEKFQAVLVSMARFLHFRQADITVVLTGGAVDCLLLKKQQLNLEVEIFGTNLTNADRTLLNAAARHAEERNETLLGIIWLNHETALQLSPKIREDVTKAALVQDEIIFQEPGLKVVAAPWSFAICNKMNCLMTSVEAQADNRTDAAQYLRYYIRLNDGRSVTKMQIRRWCQDYQMQTSNSIIDEISNEYVRLFKASGVVR